MKRTAAALLLAAVAVATLGAGVDIRVQRNEKFDFSKLKTWGWNPAGPGDVKVWLTAESKSETAKRTYEPVLVKSIEEELGKRGYTRAASGTPDFFVTYYVLVTLGQQSQQMGQFVPAVAAWGLPPFGMATQSLNVYPQGSLVLDVASQDTANVVWRGVAQAEMEFDRTEAQRSTRVRGVIKDLVAKIPKK